LAAKRKWQAEKLKSDTAYRENQAAAQKAWRKQHPDYMRHYRKSHPQYVEQNRRQQRLRNARRRKRQKSPPGHPSLSGMIVKMASLPFDPTRISGPFWVVTVPAEEIVKMEGLLLDLKPVSLGSCPGGT
jgi:hypothetical protein